MPFQMNSQHKQHMQILPAVQLLKIELEFKNTLPPESPQSIRSPLPFIGDALKWPTVTATERETLEIK